MNATTGLEIAIVGMACRVPGASSVEELWCNLRDGVESVSFFDEDELRAAGVPEAVFTRPDYVRAAGVLRDTTRFDAGLFGYSPREAEILDPQQRIFLEVVWEALERAGVDPRAGGSVGVYAGCSRSSYFDRLAGNAALRRVASGFDMLLGNDKDFLATRVAYKLGLDGPAVSVQTACSTSLAAVHTASQALLAGECDLAVAGGASVYFPETSGYVYQPDGVRSRDGHTRTFDAASSGTVRGNGVGVVVLKRLADALRDGDTVAAVVKGSAMNNDGARRVGFTAPGVEGQARVVEAALGVAGVGPETVSYVEAHGTATALGDPIEIAALTRAFRTGTDRRQYCGIGSVKTNIGHLDPAAGVAGLIKTVLMLQHRELVPSLHYERPNPKIDFPGSPFYVTTERKPWTADGPRRAGLSSFGMGGTNVHMILEEAEAAPAETAPGPYLFALSARTAAALEASTARVQAHLAAATVAPADAAFTLRRGRHPFAERRAVVGESEVAAARSLAEGNASRVFRGAAPERARRVAFLFPGQGTQHAGMGARLYDMQPVYRREVDECAERLASVLGADLRRFLHAPAADSEASARLQETRFTQPALFVVEYALARLWMSWGVTPEALLGHSVGEYVAAALAGVFERDDALALVAERARLMQACRPGAMLAVAAAAEAVTGCLEGELALAADNAPDACVIAGPEDEIAGLEARLAAEGLLSTRLLTSHAFHSPSMDPAVAPFTARVAAVRSSVPRIPFISNVTGTWITPAQATDPAYWARQLREPVRFGQGLGLLLEEPRRVLVEVGPGHALTSLARRRLPPGVGLAVPSLPHPRQPEPDDLFVLGAAGRLWVAGVDVDWTGSHGPRRRVPVPTYPFEGDRYDATVSPAVAAADVANQSQPSGDPSDWVYVPSWSRSEWPVTGPIAGERLCIFTEATGAGERLAARLVDEGANVRVVSAGSAFTDLGNGRYTVRPDSPEDHLALVTATTAAGVRRYVHLWGLPETAAGDEAFFSVLYLTQALGAIADRTTSVLVVASGVQDVLGDEDLVPIRAAALGPCTVVSQEHPQVVARHVDVPASASPETIAGALRQELTAEDRVVAHRGRSRWTPAYVRPPAASTPAASRLQPGGTYLITGGLGNVGLALAEALARRVQAKLVLVGRRGLPHRPDGTDAVRRLEELGAEVVVIAADVADPAAMAEAFATAETRFGAIHGVIHAAGLVEAQAFRLLAQIRREDCEGQLRSKGAGTEVIADLLAGRAVSFVLLTSSLSTVLGGLGFAAYAAANHYEDAVARRQHRQGRTEWISVGWDGWRPRGAPEGAGISPEEGGAILDRLLGLRGAHALVSKGDLAARRERWTPAAGKAAEPAAARHARPELQQVFVAPETAAEKRIADMWSAFLGVDRVGVHDNFFELGGDSLLAVRLTAALREAYPGPWGVATLFDAPTVRALAQVVSVGGAGGGEELDRSAGRGQLRKERQERQEIRRRSVDAAVEGQ